jgi:hypothetical protein
VSTNFTIEATAQLSQVGAGKMTTHQHKRKRPEQRMIRAFSTDWRRDPESNRARRICNPLHNRFAIAPCRGRHATDLSLINNHLGYKKGKHGLPFLNLERDKRLELSTYTLARYRSTN